MRKSPIQFIEITHIVVL